MKPRPKRDAKQAPNPPTRRFALALGEPEIRELFTRWSNGRRKNTLDKKESDLADRVGKVLNELLIDPFYPGLHSHDIDPLTKRYGRKVFQSYVDNQSEHAWRLYWVYGPGKAQITWIGLEPHPEDQKSRGYDTVQLSDLPKIPRER